MLLPEFDNGRGAGVVHEESARISEDLLREHAMVPGNNIVQPMIGKNLMKINGLITSYSEAGYKVHLHFVDLDIAKALGRALSRYISGGRLLDPNYIDSVDHLPQAVFDQIKDRPDVASYQVVSTDVPFGEPARLVESSGEPQAYPGLGGRGAPGAGEGVRAVEEGGQAPPEIGGFAEAGDVFSGASGAASRLGLEQPENPFTLDPTEVRALRWYTSNGRLINALLRKSGNDPLYKDPRARKAAESWVPVLDDIFARARWAEQGTVLYRGGVGEARLRNLKVGDTIDDPGFTSATRDLYTARAFAEKAGAAPGAPIISIELPAGARALETAKAGEHSDLAIEMAEVLLDRGTPLRFLGKDDDFYRFRAEAPAPKAAPNFEQPGLLRRALGGLGLAQGTPGTRAALAALAQYQRARGAPTDLGPFHVHEGAPLGRQAQEYVVARGRDTGAEHLVAIDENGAVIEHSRGTETALLSRQHLRPRSGIRASRSLPTTTTPTTRA
jgi:hypothetical protein